MPQDLTVRSWKPWQDRETDELIRDNYGNYKGTVTFDEHNSEPIDATFKEQPNPGDKKFGTVSSYETKSGKVRTGFKSAPRPKEEWKKPESSSAGSGSGSGSSNSWTPRDDAAIQAQMAIKVVFNNYGKPIKDWNGDDWDNVEYCSKAVMDLIVKVKTGGNQSATTLTEEPLPNPPEEEGMSDGEVDQHWKDLPY